MKISYNEFHINRNVRNLCDFDSALFASTGNVLFVDMSAVRIFTQKLNNLFDSFNQPEKRVSAGSINAMGLIDEIFHYVCMIYRRDFKKTAMSEALALLDKKYGIQKVNALLQKFNTEFPPTSVYRGIQTQEEYLAANAIDTGTGQIRSNRESTLEEMILLHLANENPAFKPFDILFDDSALYMDKLYYESWGDIKKYFGALPCLGPFSHDLITMLQEPVVFSPDSLKGQLDYIQTRWGKLLDAWLKRLLSGIDTISEEEKAAWHPIGDGGPDMSPYNYDNLLQEYERFSPDKDWMPKVVLMAKTVLVWLDQLSKKYNRRIDRLDAIPDEELDNLAQEGFTGLWLIGLWERSHASQRIKQLCGNPEAAASAYSLYDYNIAQNLGGWGALETLRLRLWQRGIRLASDMVPNHTGIDSNWVMEHPDLFVQRRDCPFPQYTFNGENLSHDGRTGVYLEDHYYSKTDCAVVFKRVDNSTGDVRYIYHGNDGTGMPWDDTAQIDFLNPAAREAVIQEILHVARNFPIIRFDAAMVLAKKHIRRLWYPRPGQGGDIATRSETGLSDKQFEDAIPNEFWREVVDRIAQEVPDTLLLAEAFWMMEGYFVRTLGMHRVYNSAFMNMLKREENEKYRATVKNTLLFDPQVLKRFVNFMNNPDEETAVAQFGKGDKYFGVCTLMVTMPGLPMFGHGQIEGFEEKYGMEYTKAYKNETPDGSLIARHWHDIFPLMKKRYIFADVKDFLFYDVWNNGVVQENVFAYSNRSGSEMAVVFYNNKYEHSCGWIKQSVPYAVKTGKEEQETATMTRSISEGLGLTAESDAYCIFKEHRSNLWYVRESADICYHGMYISLNGFEYQVLMDICQVHDTAERKYHILCDTLAGKGTADLEIEWTEIRYKDLYRALEAYLTDDFICNLHSIIAKIVKKEITTTKAMAALKKELDANEAAALAFYRMANVFAKRKRDTAKKEYKAFANSLKNIFKFIAGAKQQRRKKDYTASLRTAAVAMDVFGFVGTALNEFVRLTQMLICYAAVQSYADSGFALEWLLQRKFATLMQSDKVSYEELLHDFERLFAIAAAPNKPVTAKNIKTQSFELISFLLSSKNARMISGANIFDDVLWFNKEMSDSALAQLFTMRLITAKPEQAKMLLLQYRKIIAAKKRAAYKCELFLKPFAPKQKKQENAKTPVVKASVNAKKKVR